MDKSLITSRNENLRQNGAFAIVIFLFLGILSAAFSAIGILFLTLLLIIYPFVILPLSFSFQRAVIIMRDKNETLSLRMIFEGYRLFFTERFFSTYNLLRTVLWSLLVYFSTVVVTELVINLSFYFSNYLSFHDFVSGLADKIRSLNIEEIESYMTAHADMIKVYQLYTVLPPLFVTTFYLLYKLSVNCISMFLRFSPLKYPGRYLTLLHQNLIKKYRKSIFVDYFRLNWPLYVIFLLSMGLGGYLGYLYMFDAEIIYCFGMMGALLLTPTLFGCVYIANKEALYTKYIDKYKEVDEELQKQYMDMLNAQMQAMLKNEPKAEEELKEEEHIVDAEVEDKEIKNDSDESHDN